jgi:23S rRNA (adenine2503-C2)-methyltransferase
LYNPKARVEDVALMTLIPLALREALVGDGYVTGRVKPVEGASTLASDGTGKMVFATGDGRVNSYRYEAVGIPDQTCFVGDSSSGREGDFTSVRGWGKNRLTACVSSQSGCAMKCSFCATGKLGFKQNLSAAEIVNQVLALEDAYAKRVSNVVFMGMGEPMLNMKEVIKAIRTLNEDVGIGARSITVSTVGLPNALTKLAKHKLQCTLAVSLHAPDQATREKLVPSAKYYPIEQLIEDSKSYFKETGRRVTFEYTLLAGVNDSVYQARALGRMLKRAFGSGAHVNVIPWNNVDGINHTRPSGNAIHKFCGALAAEGVNQSIRKTRGLESNAACGQLAGQHA